MKEMRKKLATILYVIHGTCNTVGFFRKTIITDTLHVSANDHSSILHCYVRLCGTICLSEISS